jgi:hypothetical protein
MKKHLYLLLSLLMLCFTATVSVVVVNKSSTCETKQQIPSAPMNDFMSPDMPNYILL